VSSRRGRREAARQSLLTLVALTVIAAGAALWLWSLVDALRTSDQTWDAAGQSKLVWVVVIIFLGLLGSSLYLAIPKRALTRAVA
jgi:DMSO reductase anchor subunit